MDQNQWEIIILKPTFVFLSFLTAQFPDIDLPELRVLHADTTAFAIRKRESEEETLDEIERHFPQMFRHEICRWLGKRSLPQDIEVSFLDFLCCFKFELHSQIVIMEPSIIYGHQLVCIKPRSVLLKWIRSSIEDQDDLTQVRARINLSHLGANATVVVKNFKQLSDVKPFVKHYYLPLYKAEMSRMCDNTDVWPVVDSIQKFSHYFTVELHSQLIHLF